MRFRSITLRGYVGIYNGMNLMEIHIDFPYTPNKVVLIRGDNGSGKTTIMNALSVMPDNNDQFCPNIPASKEIVLEHGQIVYHIYFDHPCVNGNRGQAKAYIKKILPDGDASELNVNGNIRSYKEIIFNELGLDSNFIALSALSSENRGLATKLPAERKKFLNSIISQMETYNGIYKSLTKRANELKAMINSIAAKIGMLGDPVTIQSYLDNIEKQINDAQAHKDEAIKNLAEQQAMMKMIDSNGNLLEQAAATKARIADLEKEFAEVDRQIALVTAFIPNEGCVPMVEHTKSMWSEQVRVENAARDLAMRNIDTIDAEMATITKDIQEKQAVLAADDIDEKSLKELKLEIDDLQHHLDTSIDRLKEQFGLVIKDMSLTSDDMQMIHEALGELHDLAAVFLDEVTMEDLETVPDTPFTDVPELEEKVTTLEAEIVKANESLERMQRFEQLAARRNMIPAGCPGNCILMDGLVEIKDMTYEEIMESLVAVSDYLAFLKGDLETAKATLREHTEMNIMINTINRMKRIIKNYDKMLGKIGEHIDISILVNRQVLEDLRERVYHYITSNSALVYIINEVSGKLTTKKNLYEIQKAKMEKSKVLNDGLDQAKQRLGELEYRRAKLTSEIEISMKSISSSKQILDRIVNIDLPAAKRRDDILAEVGKLKAVYESNLEQFEKIQQMSIAADEFKKQINQWNSQLEPLFAQRDQYLHTLRLINDYSQEITSLSNEHAFIEKIRYYSSPTTGIQLVFMQYYVGNTLAMANDLLSRFFGGQFVIQPFIINDTEFRIPCMGDGYINDDISSMSSAQIAMISMVISFSLLYHSSTSFNIPKLDEIDGPLDTNNRQRFVDVLNQIIEIMNIEQCFIISHNGELESANCDVVALKLDPNVPITGNLIFRY